MNQKAILAAVVLLLAGLACGLPAASTPVALDDHAINVIAAMTIDAQRTLDALNATPTPLATNTPYPTSTLAPSSTPRPTSTPFTPMPTPTETATPLPCNRGEFIQDVTVPDGTIFEPGTNFVKAWRVKNVGTCTWTSGYTVVFASGEALGGQPSALPAEVPPGETVDISIKMVAPLAPATYQGFWKLNSDTGEVFGMGAAGDRALWVKIKVNSPPRGRPPSEGVAFDFAIYYCQAVWETHSNSPLPCPGGEGDPAGFVKYMDNINIGKRIDNGPALWTQPQNIKHGWIQGIYPLFKIKRKDRFQADVGCLADYPNCDMYFQVKYRMKNGDTSSLGMWHVTADIRTVNIDIDLTPLIDHQVELILYSETNGPADQAAGFWLMPQIYRPQ